MHAHQDDAVALFHDSGGGVAAPSDPPCSAPPAPVSDAEVLRGVLHDRLVHHTLPRMTAESDERIRCLQSRIRDLSDELAEAQRTLDAVRAFRERTGGSGLPDHVAGAVAGMVSEGVLEGAFPDSLENDRLVVRTAPIHATRDSDGAVFALGRFDLTIDIAHNMVHLDAVDDVHPTLHHPHADERGIPCLGTAQQGVVECFAERRVVDVLDMMMAFLRHANDDDAWGIRVREFPMERRGDGTAVDPPTPERAPVTREANAEDVSPENENDEDENPDDEEPYI